MSAVRNRHALMSSTALRTIVLFAQTSVAHQAHGIKKGLDEAPFSGHGKAQQLWHCFPYSSVSPRTE
eukprot:6194196-Pleurochrysis_carterae.AAC.5